MYNYFETFLQGMRPAFSRRATFVWFVVVLVGLLIRQDTLGVSSIVRALGLAPHTYPCLLHFFHSTAWSVDGLMAYWWIWLSQQPFIHRVEDRIVLIADHTKTPKDGRKMPAVTTLHQESETSSKPGFFRGHHWGCVSLLMTDQKKFWATPLFARIHQGLEQVNEDDPPRATMTLQTVHMAQKVARNMGEKAYLVLDAFFAVGPVFLEAATDLDGESQRIHILTRAKKNVVAYLPYHRPRRPSRGRPRKTVSLPKSTCPRLTRQTFLAMEKFVNVQLVALGVLQLLAARFPLHVWAESKCWLRTYTSETPSEFVTRTAFTNIIRGNLVGFGNDWISHLILAKQGNAMNPANLKKAG